MEIAYINKPDRRVMLELIGYNFSFLHLGIWFGERGDLPTKTYHYSFLDMEGSNEGARPTEVIHD